MKSGKLPIIIIVISIIAGACFWGYKNLDIIIAGQICFQKEKEYELYLSIFGFVGLIIACFCPEKLSFRRVKKHG